MIHTFGPVLIEYKLDNKFCKKLLRVGRKLPNKYNSYLAGRIENEFIYPEEQWIVDGLKPAFDYWITHSKHLFHPRTIKGLNFNAIWINRQKAGEYNPVHVHTNADLSFVLWLAVPKGLQKDIDNWKNTHTSHGQCPGYTNFYYGEEDLFSQNYNYFNPVANTILVFPAKLRHDVQAFRCKGERASVAGNVNIVWNP
jgi:hypothetical protein